MNDKLKLTLVMRQSAFTSVFFTDGTELPNVVGIRVNHEDPMNPTLMVELSNVDISLVALPHGRHDHAERQEGGK